MALDPIVELEKIETDRGITIIYAILGGSRHYNNHTDDSDYDVFYIYEGDKVKGRCADHVENYSFYGLLHSDFVNNILRSQSFYKRHNLRPDIVYIPNKLFTEDYVRDLIPQVNMNEALRSMANNIYNMHHNWSNSKRNSYNSTKKYRNLLRETMAYLWTVENNSLLYPIDMRVLVEYFNDRNWYNSAKYVLANLTVESLAKSSDLDELFKEVMQYRY